MLPADKTAGPTNKTGHKVQPPVAVARSSRRPSRRFISLTGRRGRASARCPLPLALAGRWRRATCNRNKQQDAPDATGSLAVGVLLLACFSHPSKIINGVVGANQDQDQAQAQAFRASAPHRTQRSDHWLAAMMPLRLRRTGCPSQAAASPGRWTLHRSLALGIMGGSTCPPCRLDAMPLPAARGGIDAHTCPCSLPTASTHRPANRPGATTLAVALQQTYVPASSPLAGLLPS
jgi:hypothetical protein